MESIDLLIHGALFGNDEVKKQKRVEIRTLAEERGIVPASINNLYKTIGSGKVSGFTVPAINVRTLTFDTATLIFQLMQKHHIGPVVFEIARSEIDYTAQRPDEYAVAVLAGAIKANYSGPVFIQADHVQLSKNKFTADPVVEIEKIKSLVQEAIEAGFYNVDIDASTLVDLTKPTLTEQQENNSTVTAELTRFIRNLQPANVTISIGGEIGHIGGKNSTVDDFIAFMDGYTNEIKGEGISKVSVQTGTSHGGIPLPDGTIAQVDLDFSVLESVGKTAREKYGMGGAVQHGASTLPHELFHKFKESQTLEIHLATGFQNIVYDAMPKGLKEEMYEWIKSNCASEREEGWNDEQFLYKTRKKALGPFKQKLHELNLSDKQPILDGLTEQLEFLFEQLGVFNTKDVLQYV